MFRLDPDQVSAIERAVYAERVVDTLRAAFPEAVGSLDVGALVDLAQQVEQEVIRAQSYGLHTGPQLFRFVLAAWVLGLRFDEQIGPMRTVLEDARLDATTRALRLERAVLDTLAALSHDASSASSKERA